MVVCGFRAGEEVSVSGGHGGRGVGDGGRDWVGIWKAERGKGAFSLGSGQHVDYVLCH